MIVFIKENSYIVRCKLRDAGFTICGCAYSEDSIWLDYHPDSTLPFDIHGVGYCEQYEPVEELSPIERIEYWLKEKEYFPKEREFFDTVDDFLKKYSKVVNDQPSNSQLVNRSLAFCSFRQD